jgi:hypothetical protein
LPLRRLWRKIAARKFAKSGAKMSDAIPTVEIVTA